MKRRAVVAILSFGSAASAVPVGQESPPIAISRHERTDPRSRACFSDSAGTFIRDYEPHGAVDPRNPRRLIAGWATLGRPVGTVSVAASSDGGRTWAEPTILPFNGCAGGPAAAARAADTWAAFGPDGRAYVGVIAFADSAGVDTYSTVLVSASPNGGATWNTPIVAVPNNAPTFVYDNVAITADPTRPGTVYLTTTQYLRTPRGAGPAAFARSTDGGVTWSPIRAVSPIAERERTSAPTTVVDQRTGRVYLLYFRENGPAASLVFLRSDDAGTTWSPERTVASFTRLTAYRSTRIRLGDRHPIVTAQDIIHGVVDSASRRFFVAFADARHTGGKHLQVSVTSSADGGETWTTPLRVSPPMTAHAWLPSIAVSGRTLGVSYLDTRDWIEGADGPVSTRVSLMTYSLGANGSLGAGTERRLDAFNMLGSGADSFGTGDYQALLGVPGGFGSLYVRPNCGPTTLTCPDPGKSRTDVYFAR
jgi:hypothetical protein